MTEREAYYDHFPTPLADPSDAGSPPVAAPVPAAARFRLLGRRLTGRRRLAVLDTHLPWRLSGFRFHEFSEIQRQRPDTVFFSLYGMMEPFPAPVHALADFPRLAPRLGVTDVYFVFLNFAVGLLGLSDHPDAPTVLGVRRDIALDDVFRACGMRVHVTVYPGGGLLPDTPVRLLRAIDDRADTVFTNVAEVTNALPNARFSHAVTATRFYADRPRLERDGLRLVFAADDRPRKGLKTLIEAFNQLDAAYHLDLVGPHRRHLASITNSRFAWHGWLPPEALRDIYWNADVFVSPVTRDVGGDEHSEPGTIDGFPTSTAVDAMSTGICLVTSNPRQEHRVVQAGEHYVEIPDRDPHALAGVLRELRADPVRRRGVAASGMRRIRQTMAVERGVRDKLAAMGLAPDGQNGA
jgi:glycosyltransferase involved in cell wall biosynthesis